MFITILIIANTIVLALDKYPEDTELVNISEILNEFFTWAFVADLGRGSGWESSGWASSPPRSLGEDKRSGVAVRSRSLL